LKSLTGRLAGISSACSVKPVFFLKKSELFFLLFSLSYIFVLIISGARQKNARRFYPE
jgi:hypothetical protein